MWEALSSVQSLSHVWLFVTPWTAACQASLSITNSQSLLKFMSIELVMLSNHLILCRPLLFLPSSFPSIRVFSNESVLRVRWPKYQSFSFSISPSNEYLGLISFRMDWLDLLAVQGTLKNLPNTTVQKHQFFDHCLWAQNPVAEAAKSVSLHYNEASVIIDTHGKVLFHSGWNGGGVRWVVVIREVS